MSRQVKKWIIVKKEIVQRNMCFMHEMNKDKTRHGSRMSKFKGQSNSISLRIFSPCLHFPSYPILYVLYVIAHMILLS